MAKKTKSARSASSRSLAAGNSADDRGKKQIAVAEYATPQVDSTPQAGPSAEGESASQAPPQESSAANSRERVAARAYELYLERGGGEGRETEDWLAAERELLGPSDRSNGRPVDE